MRDQFQMKDSLNLKNLSIAILFSVIFTLSGLFLMFTIILTLNIFLEGFIQDPWFLPPEEYLQNKEVYETIVESLKPIGYLCFIITLLLILSGFILNRYKISLFGSYALYIPLFGHFSFAMTALFAGIGIVRIVWIPLLDVEPDLLNAAIVIGFPSLFVLIPPLHVFYGLYVFFMFFLIPFGLFIFIFGIVAWFYGKSQGKTIINFWIYKYSRHPQYVGLILFNYGLLIIPLVMFKIMETTPTLPWLFLTLIIIGMAITEENNLLNEENEEFINWRKKTPFMIPIPNFITSFILFPMKTILKKDWPENNKEIIITLLLYGLIIVFLSLPLIPIRKEMTDFYSLIRIIFFSRR